MMRTAAFLAKLRRLDVQVWIGDGRLRCSAPEGTLTADLQAELSRRKDEIRDLLANAAAQSSPSPSIEPIDRDRRILPSFGQQRLWFIEQMALGVALFNFTGGICLEGSLDVAALQSSLAEIVRRHEILRTTLTMLDGEMAQVIGRPFSPCERVEDAVG